VPALNWFLSKGTHQSIKGNSFSYSLCQLFGLLQEDQYDLPIASISRLIDSNQYPDGIWLRADPVHISANGNRLTLTDSTEFTLTQHDALEFAAEINNLLKPYNLELEVPCPTRWYLRFNEDFKLKTTPIDSVVGQDIFPYMPRADDRINLIQLINDIQMTLHNLPINVKREQEKKIPINSVWFWGYGELPNILERNWSFVFSDESLAEGLSMLSATPFSKLPKEFNDISNKKSNYINLIVINEFNKFRHYYEFDEWVEMLMCYEMNWFSPLHEALKIKEIDELKIETDINSITVNQSSKYEFWKRRKRFIS
jgi:hypothetical protein